MITTTRNTFFKQVRVELLQLQVGPGVHLLQSVSSLLLRYLCESHPSHHLGVQIWSNSLRCLSGQSSVIWVNALYRQTLGQAPIFLDHTLLRNGTTKSALLYFMILRRGELTADSMKELRLWITMTVAARTRLLDASLSSLLQFQQCCISSLRTPANYPCLEDFF